jgi:uroporphyrin-3 C-methyltransferase
LAAEVEYLLQLANYRLLLARDPATAIQALTLADRRLAEAGGAKWQTLRAQLASDINRLRALEMPDPAAIAVRLVNLEQGVNSLRLLEAQGGTGGPEEQAGDVSPSRERSFDTLLRDSWDGLRSVLVIRRHDQPPSIGLPPEQRYFAYQNLRMQLAAARLALLRGDQSQYQASLQQVERWLQEFFAPESPATLEFLRETRELGQIDLRPALPDISATLIAPDERGRPEAGVSAAE